MKVLKWLSASLSLCILGGGIYFLNGALPIGTGYSAKYLCSQVFLAGRDPSQVFENDVKPTHPLFSTVSPSVDYKNKTVTAKAFGFWKPMTAVYREGCGCTLAVGISVDELSSQTVNISHPEISPVIGLWPEGNIVNLEHLPANVNQAELNAAIGKAFTEPGPETQRNTQAVVVVLGDKIIAEKYAPGFDEQTPILGWSMAKSVTSILVGILVKDGKLDIYQPAPVSAWKAEYDPRGKITLDMLLRMSSGLEFEEVYGPFKDATAMLYASRSMADYAAAKPLVAPVDTVWNYSSGTANIIAKIAVDATGKNLEKFYQFARTRLFDRIGAVSPVIEPDASGSVVGSSYMFATAKDWARFGLFLKNDGVWENERILPEGWMRYATTPTPGASRGQYGAQFWLNAGEKNNPANRKFPSLPSDLYYCGGFNGQIVAVIPSRDIVVVRLGATHDDSWDHEIFIRQILNAVKNI